MRTEAAWSLIFDSKSSHNDALFMSKSCPHDKQMMPKGWPQDVQMTFESCPNDVQMMKIHICVYDGVHIALQLGTECSTSRIYVVCRCGSMPVLIPNRKRVNPKKGSAPHV